MLQYLVRHVRQKRLRLGFGLLLMVSVTSPAFCQSINVSNQVFVSRNFMGQPVPKWENGYLVGFEFTPERSPTVYAYDRNGKRLFETFFEIEGAYRVVLRSMAASRDGRFAFSGFAENGSSERAYFIGFVDSTGRTIRVTKLDRIAARHLCFAGDGTLWAAVQAVVRHPDRNAPDHEILRGYGPDGNLKFSSLLRSSFVATPEDPLQPHPVDDAQNAASQLSANDSEVVFMTSGFKELVKVSSVGKLLSRTRMERPNNSYLTGFALGAEGTVYLSTQEADPALPKIANFVFYRWNPASSKWDSLFSRPTRDRGLPLAVAMMEANRMLVKSEEGQFRWIAAADGEYAFWNQP